MRRQGNFRRTHRSGGDPSSEYPSVLRDGPLLESLEPRLLLDSAGPAVVSHWPVALAGPGLDVVQVTFNEAIDPATFTAADLAVALAEPRLKGISPAASDAWCVDVHGDRAYVADNSNGLRVFDIANPAAPALLGTHVTPGMAIGVDVVGSLAYVADHTAGLRIVDVSDPAAMSEVGFLDTPGVAVDVQVVGTIAYVADVAAGLRIIDVTTPTSPTEAGFFDTPGTAVDVDVKGNYAYVADDNGGLRIIDVSTPAAATEAGSYATPADAWAVDVVGNIAYVAASFRGLRILDVSDPAAVTEIGVFDTVAFTRGVQVVGPLAYLADFGLGVRVIDISNPAATKEVAFHATTGATYRVHVDGSLAYVADGSGGVPVVQVGADVDAVSQTGPATYRVDLAQPLADGGHTVFLKPNLADTAGNPMDQDADGIGGEHWDDLYQFDVTVGDWGYVALKRGLGTASGATLATGDLDGDGDADWNDLAILRRNMAGPTSPAATAGAGPSPDVAEAPAIRLADAWPSFDLQDTAPAEQAAAMSAPADLMPADALLQAQPDAIPHPPETRRQGHRGSPAPRFDALSRAESMGLSPAESMGMSPAAPTGLSRAESRGPSVLDAELLDVLAGPQLAAIGGEH